MKRSRNNSRSEPNKPLQRTSIDATPVNFIAPQPVHQSFPQNALGPVQHNVLTSTSTLDHPSTPIFPAQYQGFAQSVLQLGPPLHATMAESPVHDLQASIPDAAMAWDYSNQVGMTGFTPLYDPLHQLPGPGSSSDSYPTEFAQTMNLLPNVTNPSTASPSIASAPTPLYSMSAPEMDRTRSQLQSGMYPLQSTPVTALHTPFVTSPSQDPQSEPSSTKKRKAPGSPPRPRRATQDATISGVKRKSIAQGLTQDPTERPTNTDQRGPLNSEKSGVADQSVSTGEGVSPKTTAISADPTSTSQMTPSKEGISAGSREGKKPESSTTVQKSIEAKQSSMILPAGQVFPIQVGSQMFRISGASISSDAPSYFSLYFQEQMIQATGRPKELRPLYLDRDPETFKDIVLHLQGYHLNIRDGEHFVKVYADAQYYRLPKLTRQLFKSEIFIQIGDRNFGIPRDLFSAPGNSPNYFSLGFAHFFATPAEGFPGLDRQNLLRPPSLNPPALLNRSADVFADIMRLLQGYDVHIRDEEHRQDLIRDAKYFHFKGLEQRLLPVKLSYNLTRGTKEIVLRLEDLRQSGVSFLPDATASSSGSDESDSSNPVSPGTKLSSVLDSGQTGAQSGYVAYARPFVDAAPASLILDISAVDTVTLQLRPRAKHVTERNDDTNVSSSRPPAFRSSSSQTTRSKLVEPVIPVRTTSLQPQPTTTKITSETKSESRPDKQALLLIEFTGQTKARVAAFYQVIANRLKPTTRPPRAEPMMSFMDAAPPTSDFASDELSADLVNVRITTDSWIEVDGDLLIWAPTLSSDDPSSRTSLRDPPHLTKKGKEKAGQQSTVGDDRMKSAATLPGFPVVSGWRLQSGPAHASRSESSSRSEADLPTSFDAESWTIKRSQWRVRVEPKASVNSATPDSVRNTKQESSDSSAEASEADASTTKRVADRSAGRVASEDAAGGLHIILEAVRLEAYSSEWARNGDRAFLS